MIDNISKINSIPEHLIMPDTNFIALTISCHIIQIRSIDTITQTFESRIMFIFNWKTLKKFEEINLLKDNNGNYNEWVPTIHFLNNKKKIQKLYEELNKIKRKKLYSQMSYKIMYDGIFLERYNLKHFPIDTQRLHIRIIFIDFPQSILKDFEEHLPNSFKLFKASNLLYEEGFNEKNEWELVSGININEGKSIANRTDGYRYKTINIYITISRKVGFYIWNAFIPVTVIVFCSCVSFIIDRDDLFGASTLTFTMILSLIALKFTLLRDIQTTSSMTYFDKYMLSAFIFIAVIILQNVITYSIYTNEIYLDKNNINLFNIHSGIFITASWFLFSVIILIIMSFKKLRHMISYPIDDISFKELDIDNMNLEIFQPVIDIPDITII
jgi:hypothetical protein